MGLIQCHLVALEGNFFNILGYYFEKHMEERRNALAILLCTIIVIFWSQMMFAPYQQPQQQTQGPNKNIESQPSSSERSSTNQGSDQTNKAHTNTEKTSDTSPKKIAPAEAQHLTIDNDVLQISLSSIGARIEGINLKKYLKNLGSSDRLELTHLDDQTVKPGGIEINSHSDSGVPYTITEITGLSRSPSGQYTISGDSNLSITFRGIDDDLGEITKTFTFHGNSYLIDVTVTAATKEKPILLDWTESISQEDLNERLDPIQVSYLSSQKSLTHVPLSKLGPLGIQDVGAVKWIAFGTKYFMVALVPLVGESSQVTPGSSLLGLGKINHHKDGATIAVTGSPSQAQFKIYLGPKDMDVLAPLGSSLERGVDLGVFAFLAAPLLKCINILFSFLGNYGLAIITLTLIIKLLLLPLAQAGFKSMAKMKEIQPEMQALRERYKDGKDNSQLNQEMMALYKRKGVNPLGGCFPILIQIPVFFGLYSALLNSIDLRHAPFALWITDLSAPEHLQLLGMSIPPMILLLGVSMFVQQYTQPSTMDPQQQKIMMFMPVMVTGMFILYPMPSGLVLYWVVSNTISIVQQMYIRNLRGNPFVATIIASIAIFFIGYVLTLV